MNFLNVFEQRVGSLFGATTQGVTAPFSFKKLAKKAAREMEAETFVINGVDTAPALYTILISSEDDITMRPLYAQLTKETSQFIEGQAQGKGYVFVGKPVVRFMADPSLKSGRFSVFAENVDAGTLNRLREEEARFLGADSSLDGGLGGAASSRAQAPGMRPVPQPQPQAAPISNMESGLDVMPQEAVLEAEDAFFAQGRAARQYQNVPLVGSRASQAPVPMAPVAAPAPVAAATPASAASAVPAAAAGFAAGAAAQAIPGAATPQQAYAAPQPAPQTVRVAPAAPAPAANPAACLLIDRKSGRTFTASAPRTVIGRERSAGL